MKEITENCPREGCEGTVRAEVEYEPGESNYGADADGNRGVYVRGHYSATAGICSTGHTLTDEEQDDVTHDAMFDAEQDEEANYEEPDQYDTCEERDNDY